MTGVIDAGGGFQNYPEDYQIIEELHRDGQLTVRIAYNYSRKSRSRSCRTSQSWAKQVRPGQGDDIYRNNGAGEMLVYSAADFEDFQVERPDMPPYDGDRPRAGDPSAGDQSLAVAAACHLQRDDHARA